MKKAIILIFMLLMIMPITYSICDNYDYYITIDGSSFSWDQPYSINTSGVWINGTRYTIHTLYKGQSYICKNSSTIISVHNNSGIIPFEVNEIFNYSYNVKNIWDSSYYMVNHFNSTKESTNRHHVNNSGVDFATNSFIGKAGTFVSAQSDYMQMQKNFGIFDGNSHFTIMYWINATSLIDSMRIVSLRGESYIRYMYSSNSWYAHCKDSGDANHDIYYYNQSTNKWLFFVYRYNMTSNAWQVFVNNKLKNATTTADFKVTSGVPSTIGCKYDITNHYNGIMDELYIIQEAVTNEEIEEFYNNGIGTSAYGDINGSWNIVVGNSVPVIQDVTPLTGDHSNQHLTATFNVTDADGDNVNCSLYVNGTVQLTKIDPPLSTSINFQFNFTYNYNYTWAINCTDGPSSTETQERNYIYDTINPDITWTKPVKANTTVYQIPPVYVEGQAYLNISFNDTYLYRCNVTVWYPNGTIWYQNLSGDIDQQTYNVFYNFSTRYVNATDMPYGWYDVSASATDDSTYSELKYLVKEKYSEDYHKFVDYTNNVQLQVKFETYNQFGTKKDNKNLSSVIEDVKLKDKLAKDKKTKVGEYNPEAVTEYKYGYTFEIDADSDYIVITLTNPSNDFSLRTKYKAHFIWGKGKYYTHFDDAQFITVNGKSEEAEITLLSYSSSEVKVKIQPVKKFKSGDVVYIDPVTGGTNIIHEEARFWVNRPPLSGKANMTPSSFGVHDIVTCINGTYSDPDGHPKGSSFSVFFMLNNLSACTINNGALTTTNITWGGVWGACGQPEKGDNVSCAYMYTDNFSLSTSLVGANWINQWFSVPMMIVNTPPSLSTVTLSPASPTVLNDLTCSWTEYDVDGDTIYNNTKWFNGSIVITALNNETVVTSGNTTVGDNWTCSVQIYDGENMTAWQNSSFVIVSGVNITAYARISPLFPYDNENLQLFCNGTSASGDNITYYWNVTRNGALFASGQTSHWCYQEFANESATCGNPTNGSYKILNTSKWHHSGERLNDGNWLAGDFITDPAGGNYDYYYVNYSKPPGATITSQFQISVRSNFTVYNLTLPQSCWDQQPLQFQIDANDVCGPAWCTNTSCWNGTNYVSLHYESGQTNFNEEGMWWYFVDNYTDGTEVNVYNVSAVNTSSGDVFELSCQARTPTLNSTAALANVTVFTPLIDNCSTYNTTAINLTIYDASSLAVLNGSIDGSFTVWVTSPTAATTINLSWSGNSDGFGICISPASANYTFNAQLEYTSPGYATETHYFYQANMDNVTDDVSLYLDQNSSLVVFTVTDQDDDPVQEVYIHVLAYDLGTDSSVTTEILRTNQDGQDVGHIILNTQRYKFLLYYRGNLVLETEDTILTLQAYNFRINILEDYINDYTTVRGVNCLITNTSNAFSFSYSDPAGTITKGCLKVITRSPFGDVDLSDQCSPSASGTINFDPGVVDSSVSYIGTGYIIHNGKSFVCEVASLNFDNTYKALGNMGLFASFMISLSMIFIGIWNPIAAIVMFIVAIVFSVIMKWFAMTWMAIISLVILAGLAIYRLNK